MKFWTITKKFLKYHKVFYKSNIRFIKNFKKFNIYYLHFNTILTSSILKTLIKLIKVNLKPYKKLFKLRMKIIPIFGKTKKPKDIRMGRGKGEINERVNFYRGGKVLLLFKTKHLNNIPMEYYEYVFYQCSKKLQQTSYIIFDSNKWLK